MTFDAFAKVAAAAANQEIYLSNAQVDALIGLVRDSNKRMDAVNRITDHASKIVTDASQSLFAEQPQLVAPGGNVSTNRQATAYLKALETILRYVTYALFVGDASILEDWDLNELQDIYVAQGVPGTAIAAGIGKLKEASIRIVSDPANITPGDCSSLTSELSGYFDWVAAAVA